VTAIWFLGAMF